MTYAEYCAECEIVGFVPMSEHNWDVMVSGIARRPQSLTLERVRDEREIETEAREGWGQDRR